jgi:hypothetical protein
VRPRLRRLVSWWRGVAPASQAALPPPETQEAEQDSDPDTARRLDDARARLKQSVPPQED